MTLAAKLDHPVFEKEREFEEVKFVFGRIFVSLSINIHLTNICTYVNQNCQLKGGGGEVHKV